MPLDEVADVVGREAFRLHEAELDLVVLEPIVHHAGLADGAEGRARAPHHLRGAGRPDHRHAVDGKRAVVMGMAAGDEPDIGLEDEAEEGFAALARDAPAGPVLLVVAVDEQRLVEEEG